MILNLFTGKGNCCGVCVSIFLLFACVGGMIYGMYELIQSKKDEHSSQAEEYNTFVAEWEESWQSFSGLNVTLTGSALLDTQVTLPERDYESDHYVDYDDFDDYNVTRYTLNGDGDDLFVKDLTTYRYVNGTEDPFEYTLYADFSLQIDGQPLAVEIPLLKRKEFELTYQMCLNHHTGVWIHEAGQCYYHYYLYDFCVALAQPNDAPNAWVIDTDVVNCGTTYKRFSHTKAGSDVTPHKIRDLEINVRSTKDPVVRFDDKEVIESATQLEIAGVIVLIFSTLLAIALIIYLCKVFRKPKNTLETV